MLTGNTKLGRRRFLHGLFGTAAAAIPVWSSLSAAQSQKDAPVAAGQPYSGYSDDEPWFMQKDAAWVRQLSQPKYDVHFEFDKKIIPMRDGVKLAANIWRPAAEGKFPVVYIHLAYDKSNTTFCVNRAKY